MYNVKCRMYIRLHLCYLSVINGNVTEYIQYIYNYETYNCVTYTMCIHLPYYN